MGVDEGGEEEEGDCWEAHDGILSESLWVLLRLLELRDAYSVAKKVCFRFDRCVRVDGFEILFGRVRERK